MRRRTTAILLTADGLFALLCRRLSLQNTTSSSGLSLCCIAARLLAAGNVFLCAGDLWTGTTYGRGMSVLSRSHN